MNFTIGTHNHTGKFHIFVAKKGEGENICYTENDSLCNEVNINDVSITNECLNEVSIQKFALGNSLVCHNCRKDLEFRLN